VLTLARLRTSLRVEGEEPIMARGAVVVVVVAVAAVLGGCGWPSQVPTRWTSIPRPSGPAAASYAADCPSSTSCYAVARSGSSVQRWDGASWSTAPVAVPDGVRWSLGVVSCPAAEACLLGGTAFTPTGPATGAPLLVRWDGATTTEIPLPAAEGRYGVRSLSCPSPTWCMVSAPPGFVVWDGSAVRETTLPVGVGVGIPQAVSCGAPTNCAAVASASEEGPPAVVRRGIVMWDGTSWAFSSTTVAGVGEPVPYGPTVYAVACTGPSLCVAGGEVTTGPDTARVARAVVATWRGSWSPFAPVASPRGRVAGPTTVSCAGPDWCVALGGTGFGLLAWGVPIVWTGTAWSYGPDQPTVRTIRVGPPPPPPAALTCARGERWCLVLGPDVSDVLVATGQ
jgi:hypothetical protein